MKKQYSVSLAEAETAARSMARQLKGGEILALVGPLGSGKTTFTKALGRALKIKEPITSPTFVLMHVFQAKIQKKQAFLYHLDLYRTKNFHEAAALGLTEVWGQPNVVTVIEWADKIKTHLPKKTTFIYFSHGDAGTK
jgi:tRNA threonylcarbamoyladenosine biosynthesis protein TsaE